MYRSAGGLAAPVIVGQGAGGSSTQSSLSAALDYRARGWCVIPMRNDRKVAAVKWGRFQRQHPTDAQFRTWFGRPDPFGIAVIFGAISGGLVSRDFDSMDSYNRWAATHPDLAATLPTVETKRGRHVYCTATDENVSSFRAAIGKPGGVGAITCDGGELRCGVGCYSLLPPSAHPDGPQYRWASTLPDHFPEVDLFNSGFYQCSTEGSGEQRQLRRCLEGTVLSELSPLSMLHESVIGSGSVQRLHACLDQSGTIVPPQLSPEKCPNVGHLPPDIELAIVRSLPTGSGQRHRQLFELARELKAVPSLAGASLPTLKPYVRRWHATALDTIHTKAWEESWLDFCNAWPLVKYAKGAEPIAVAFERAKAAELPASAFEYDSPGCRLLVAFCAELQHDAGPEPFYLSSWVAADLLAVNHSTAHRWLKVLCVDGVLELVETGSHSKRKASRYRYVATPENARG